MKKVLNGLIPTVGLLSILTTGFLVSAPEPASAYCVHNLTGETIRGYDKWYHSRSWKETLQPEGWDLLD